MSCDFGNSSGLAMPQLSRRHTTETPLLCSPMPNFGFDDLSALKPFAMQPMMCESLVESPFQCWTARNGCKKSEFDRRAALQVHHPILRIDRAADLDWPFLSAREIDNIARVIRLPFVGQQRAQIIRNAAGEWLAASLKNNRRHQNIPRTDCATSCAATLNPPLRFLRVPVSAISGRNPRKLPLCRFSSAVEQRFCNTLFRSNRASSFMAENRAKFKRRSQRTAFPVPSFVPPHALPPSSARGSGRRDKSRSS